MAEPGAGPPITATTRAMRKISYGVLARRVEKETRCPRDVAVEARQDGPTWAVIDAR
ncbi:hypothetical protein GCM10009525_13320 [Streptosporangium amethystogenes subsp. fukuiense]